MKTALILTILVVTVIILKVTAFVGGESLTAKEESKRMFQDHNPAAAGDMWNAFADNNK